MRRITTFSVLSGTISPQRELRLGKPREDCPRQRKRPLEATSHLQNRSTFRPCPTSTEVDESYSGDIAMASTRVLTGLVIVAALAATPVSADQGRRRAESDRGRERNAEQS